MSNERPGRTRTACVFWGGEFNSADQAGQAAEDCEVLFAADSIVPVRVESDCVRAVP